MLKLLKSLHQQGVLGINRRNLDYIFEYNRRDHYPIVDNKLLTKKLAEQHGIAVPTLYAVIHNEGENKRLPQQLSAWSDFVIKPAHGSGGNGIVVITETIKNHYRKSSGALITGTDLSFHISNILSGVYSLGGHPDVALIEYRVQSDPVFEKITYQGVPDVRVIVYRGYPAMAMIRLPTRASDGKANLHQGAIGVGINMVTGITLGGVSQNHLADTHPDTLELIADQAIPHWDTILQLAACSYDLTQLGYLGVDIVLDRERGPLILELNARPGLNIQIANRSGLIKRYEKIDQYCDQTHNVDQRIQAIKTWFS